jgi:hypothetical protein
MYGKGYAYGYVHWIQKVSNPRTSVQRTGAFFAEQVPHSHFVKISDRSYKHVQHNLFINITYFL